MLHDRINTFTCLLLLEQYFLLKIVTVLCKIIKLMNQNHRKNFKKQNLIIYCLDPDFDHFLTNF